jgi:hypothetical protein
MFFDNALIVFNLLIFNFLKPPFFSKKRLKTFGVSFFKRG